MSEFAEQLASACNGRFRKQVESVRVMDICRDCYHFSPHVTDPGKGYRCRVTGSCPGATFSEGLTNMLWRSLDEAQIPLP